MFARALSRPPSLHRPALRYLHRTPLLRNQSLQDASETDDLESDLFPGEEPDPEPVLPGGKRTNTPLERYERLVEFVTPRVGRAPTEKTPLARRSVFPQLIQLSREPEHLETISKLMISWKEGNLGTQGRARFRKDGKPRGANPFDLPTSELFARRCDELGVPELALKVFGDLPTYALPMTLHAARRLLHSLIAADRPLSEVVTVAALFESHQLPPAVEDYVSCALLTQACIKHLRSEPDDAQTRSLVYKLIQSLENSISAAEPMPTSKDVRDKALRAWTRSALKEIVAFLDAKPTDDTPEWQKPRPTSWLEGWMVKSQFRKASLHTSASV
ncbi:hypothetical protein MKEN_00515200 [Mycena kentingensis (nom. inval.)]|nr:hypothetical protein MKEN_00515200 [Mycena kentingensis (nom. inval.)]